MNLIDFTYFSAIDLRVGTIKAVEKIEKSKKLLKFEIDLGDKTRQILSGIAQYYPEYKQLIGKQVVVIINLEPRTMLGLESQGMILMATDSNNKPILLSPEQAVPAGAKIN